jgi:hypothetical protein
LSGADFQQADRVKETSVHPAVVASTTRLSK